MGYEKRYEQYDVNMRAARRWCRDSCASACASGSPADGAVLRPLDEAGRSRRRASRRRGSGVAVGFLHAYAWPAHERRARELLAAELGPDVTISLSSEVCPEMREYERFSTTCANAYVRPLMAGYLARLTRLRARPASPARCS